MDPLEEAPHQARSHQSINALQPILCHGKQMNGPRTTNPLDTLHGRLTEATHEVICSIGLECLRSFIARPHVPQGASLQCHAVRTLRTPPLNQRNRAERKEAEAQSH